MPKKSITNRAALSRNCRRPSRGFTLIEIVIVIGLVLLIGGLGLFMSMSGYRGSTFHSERDLVVAVLHRSRLQAMHNVCIGECFVGKAHGVHFDDGRYILFQGDMFDPDDETNEEIPTRDASIVISGPPDVLFLPLSGRAAPADIGLTNNAEETSIISIGSEGQISWTN